MPQLLILMLIGVLNIADLTRGVIFTSKVLGSQHCLLGSIISAAKILASRHRHRHTLSLHLHHKFIGILRAQPLIFAETLQQPGREDSLLVR